MSKAVRAVEIGSILPRTEGTSRRLPSRRVLLVAAALIVLAGIIVLSPLINTVLDLVTNSGSGATSGGQGATGLGGLVMLVKVIVALALVGIALALIVRSVEPEVVGGPISPDHVNLLSLPKPDVQQAGAHLAGRHETCDTPRGMAAGEIVIARITEESADRLSDIPSECRQRRRESGLFPVLVGVPSADRDVVEDVSDAYQTTVLVDADATNQLPKLLGLLAYLCGNANRDEAAGIGGSSLKCIEIAGHDPTDPDLQDEIREGLGEPLASEVNEARSDERAPAATILSAPPDYLETAIESLPDQDEPLVPVRTPGYGKIHIARLFIATAASDSDTRWEVREAVIQDGLGGP